MSHRQLAEKAEWKETTGRENRERKQRLCVCQALHCWQDKNKETNVTNSWTFVFIKSSLSLFPWICMYVWGCLTRPGELSVTAPCPTYTRTVSLRGRSVVSGPRRTETTWCLLVSCKRLILASKSEVRLSTIVVSTGRLRGSSEGTHQSV